MLFVCVRLFAWDNSTTVLESELHNLSLKFLPFAGFRLISSVYFNYDICPFILTGLFSLI